MEELGRKLNRDLGLLVGGIIAAAGLVGGAIAVAIDTLIRRHRERT